MDGIFVRKYYSCTGSGGGIIVSRQESIPGVDLSSMELIDDLSPT